MKIIETIKNILKTSPAKNYIFICLDCNTEFDGSQVEIFIKHQIDEKHYNASKKVKL